MDANSVWLDCVGGVMKDETAFPFVKNNGRQVEYSYGLTKREYFAAMAMQGLLSAVYSNKEMLDEFMKVEYSPRPRGIGEGEYRNGRESISTNALAYADALIAELEKGSGGLGD